MVFLVMVRASSHAVRSYVFMRYSECVMICIIPYRDEVFIEAIDPRISLEMITAHLVCGGPLNPYFLGRR